MSMRAHNRRAPTALGQVETCSLLLLLKPQHSCAIPPSPVQGDEWLQIAIPPPAPCANRTPSRRLIAVSRAALVRRHTKKLTACGVEGRAKPGHHQGASSSTQARTSSRTHSLIYARVHACVLSRARAHAHTHARRTPEPAAANSSKPPSTAAASREPLLVCRSRSRRSRSSSTSATRDSVPLGPLGSADVSALPLAAGATARPVAWGVRARSGTAPAQRCEPPRPVPAAVPM